MSSECYNHAVLLLSQREHSAVELMQKLAKKGHDSSTIEHAITQCRQQGYQSDERFAEMVLRVRVAKGYGPLRIQQILLAKGLKRPLVSACIEASKYDWFELAATVWRKKYGKSKKEVSEVTQKRFLHYRGFESSQINHALRSVLRIECI